MQKSTIAREYFQHKQSWHLNKTNTSCLCLLFNEAPKYPLAGHYCKYIDFWQNIQNKLQTSFPGVYEHGLLKTSFV